MPHKAFTKVRLHRYHGKPCPYCQRIMDRYGRHLLQPSRDHRVPIARGGLNVLENIAICCKGCNEDKNMLTAAEYIQVLAGNASRLDTWWWEQNICQGDDGRRQESIATMMAAGA